MSQSTIYPRDIIEQALREATGRMRFTLTNDYLFRATLQRSKFALKGLLCSVLNKKPEEIVSVEILNPIELGENLNAKDFILDIKVILNNNTVINIEMQVANLGNWPERSLGYLCRSFDNLGKGMDYMDVMPVVQVSFLDFTLFKDAPEFFSTYMFQNVKNNRIYSDKLQLHVVNLTCIDLATEEDKLRGIDYWARLFKATTWEEVKMLAAKNEYIEEAVVTLRQLTNEERVRLQCEAREDYYRQQNYIQRKLAKLEDLEESISEKEQVICEKERVICEKEQAICKKEQVIYEKEQVIYEKEQVIYEKEQVIENQALEIARLRAQLSQLQDSKS